MADRLKALRRIAKVQAEMVKLAEWRIAAADKRIEALHEDRARLGDYVSGGGFEVPIAKAALRAMLAIDQREAETAKARAAETTRLDALRRRDRAIAARIDTASAERRRAVETAELTSVVEAWLAKPDDEATTA